MKRVMLALLFSLVATVASAQAATPASRLFWDVNAPDTQTAANVYVYRYYPDASTTGIVLTGISCATTTTAGLMTCNTVLPAFTAGSHTLVMTAANEAGESLKSAPLPFVFVVVPGAPRNLRIVP